ncbi:TrmB family transcriptional regulator [bacterium]|nr:TrmB family transcriptional regulator [bacterium]
MDDVLEKLKELGFNSYEAKVYLALLKKYPATGYEIAQIADIPQSRAYDALKSLVSAKIAFSTDDKPQKYTPISPKELTQRFKRKINSTIDYLEKKLPDVKEDYNEPIHSVSGYETILKKLKEVIKNTKKSIYLEIWSNDFKHLEQTLLNAYDRGVDIKIVGYDNFSAPFGLVYPHDGGKEIEFSLGSRLIYILSDETESVFGKIESNVVWTKNKDVAFLVKQFIVHDMYLLDVNKQFPEQLRYFYGAGFKKLKDKIVTKDSNYYIH